ncbi:MAG: hypothetical protein OXG35_14800 [Acidobacteria bacterium]|nr:hypothetical protein [Acidobacteriota bacterium]
MNVREATLAMATGRAVAIRLDGQAIKGRIVRRKATQTERHVFRFEGERAVGWFLPGSLHAADERTDDELHDDIRAAFPASRETVVEPRTGCVWLATHDGRFISLGRTLVAAAMLARENGHRARAVRRSVERAY